MPSSHIKAFLNKHTKHFFHNNNGVVEIPFLANSPELVTQSFESMPFMRKKDSKNALSTINLFFKGEYLYKEIENDLWLILSDITAKRDLSFRSIYNDDFIKKYYSLTVQRKVSTTTFTVPKSTIEVIPDSEAVTLCKPGGAAPNIYPKDYQTQSVTIYFSKKWLKNYITEQKLKRKGTLSSYISSESDFLYLPYFLKTNKLDAKNIITRLFDTAKEQSEEQLSTQTRDLVSTLLTTLDNTETEQFEIKESEKNYNRLLKAEKIILTNLLNNFPGIDFVAKEIGMSGTKLKVDFKRFFGKSVFQYYRNSQMMIAKELLASNRNLKIKSLGAIFGYGNSSKFSSAFLKTNNCLPSETRKKTA